MKHFLALLAMFLTTAAMAQGTTCNAAATEKKLTGTAKAAFLKKCEMDAKAKFELVSQEKKLSVAPTSTFGKNCERDSEL